MNFIYNTKLCTGCRSCEIACSYRHNGVFSRKGTSITVSRMESEGKFDIVLWLDEKRGHVPCDNCAFCLAYCPLSARNELKAALNAAAMVRGPQKR